MRSGIGAGMRRIRRGRGPGRARTTGRTVRRCWRRLRLVAAWCGRRSGRRARSAAGRSRAGSGSCVRGVAGIAGTRACIRRRMRRRRRGRLSGVGLVGGKQPNCSAMEQLRARLSREAPAVDDGARVRLDPPASAEALGAAGERGPGRLCALRVHDRPVRALGPRPRGRRSLEVRGSRTSALQPGDGVAVAAAER
jgi:hypothetical protein